jgi:DNA-binding transcriptional LysR family regulator
VFPTIEASLRDGSLDFYVGPPPQAGADSGLVVEHLFDNRRVIVGRRGHPLRGARHLSELVDAEWITTSVTLRAADELAPLFADRGLPSPRLVMQASSALGFIAALTSSDLLMLLPVQWLDYPLTRDALMSIDVIEPLPAPPICVVHRAGLPLTPAGEYFCDLVRRAAVPYQHAAKARTASRGGAAPSHAARGTKATSPRPTAA